jgi:uncharacterized membrane protein YphA (DoxX/SURF4 family)
MRRKTLIEIIAALFVLLFAYTAASKIMDFRNFKFVLRDSPFIGESLAPIAAYGIVLVEMVVSLLLILPKTRKTGLWSSLGLMLVFTIYIGYVSMFASHKPCGCGGVISKMNWTQHFYFNIFFTLLAALGLWLHRKRRITHDRDEIQQVVFT